MSSCEDTADNHSTFPPSNTSSSKYSNDGLNGKRMTLGVLSDGTRFIIPPTFDVISALYKPSSWKSFFTQLWVLTIVMLLWSLYIVLRGTLPRYFLVFQFLFWRLAYNFGIGWLLYIQSNGEGFVKLYERIVEKNDVLNMVLESAVVFNDETKYEINKFPKEFNAWMCFRFIAMIVLSSDLVSYVIMVIAFSEYPNFYNPVDIILYIIGILFIIFAIASKVDAQHIIGDYAWHWGDFFFLKEKKLALDGVFQMFPHPMYSAGYAFVYGFSIMSKSSIVFYASLFCHMSQLIFLTIVENPHIQKTYNTNSEPSDDDELRDKILYDPENGYLNRNELVVLKNFDITRSSDFIHLILVLYAVALAVLFDCSVYVYLIHYALWRAFHTFGIGYILREQSRSKWWTKKFKTPQHAFDSWKQLYNVSVVMTNTSYLLCAYKMFTWEGLFLYSESACMVCVSFGLYLVFIHIYVITSVYDAIGDFGYFYGDFFVDDVHPKLTYSGIYRFVNNPDSVFGFTGYYGLSLITGNIMMVPIAALSHGACKLFEFFVENPHMRSKYSNIRDTGGLISGINEKRESYRAALLGKKNDCKLILQKFRDNLKN